MNKQILSEIDLYHGEVKMPKNYEINRSLLKEEIIYSALFSEDRKSNNKLDVNYLDYKIKDTTSLTQLTTYFKDFITLNFNFTLILKDFWGNITYPQEQTLNRNTVAQHNLKDSPDYTLIYGVDVYDKDSKIIIEYDNNRRVGNTWHIPIKDNSFVMFPSTQRYFISKNNSDKLNTYLTLTFDYMR